LPVKFCALLLFSDAASRCGDHERARHFPGDALDRAGADAEFTGDFQDAVAGPQSVLYALFNLIVDAWTAKRLAGRYGPFQASRRNRTNAAR
jgi:hypothetical protein